MNRQITKIVGRYTTTKISKSVRCPSEVDFTVRIAAYHLGWDGATADSPIKAVKLSELGWVCDDPAKIGSYIIDACGYLTRPGYFKGTRSPFVADLAKVDVSMVDHEDRMYTIMCEALDRFVSEERDVRKPWQMRGYGKWPDALKRKVRAKIKQVGCAFVDGYVVPHSNKPYDYNYMVRIIRDSRMVADFWSFKSHQKYINHVMRALNDRLRGSAPRLWSARKLQTMDVGYVGDPRSDAARDYTALLVVKMWLSHYQATANPKLHHTDIDMRYIDPHGLLDCIHSWSSYGVQDITFGLFISLSEMVLNSPHVSDYLKRPIAQLLVKVCDDLVGKPEGGSVCAITTWIANAITEANRISDVHFPTGGLDEEA